MFTWAQTSTSQVQGSQYANLLEKSLDYMLNSKNSKGKSIIFGLKRPGLELPPTSYRTMCKTLKTSDLPFLTYKMRIILATSTAVTVKIK